MLRQCSFNYKYIALSQRKCYSIHRGEYMSNLGARLKNYREKIGLSLKQVDEATGITDSRLSRIEKGQTECPAQDLKKLATIYQTKVIPLFIQAGYLSNDDLEEYQLVFKGVGKLDTLEIQHIQVAIDLFNRKKGD